MWFKEKLNAAKDQMRMEKESEQLVQWKAKVDDLMLYMAHMEDKIKLEQEAR